MIALLAGCQSDDESHSHTFADSWSSDATNHWHAADCGHDEKKDEAKHTFDDGKITTPATESTEGVKTFTCTVCSYKKTESIPALGHTHTFDTENWEKDATHHWHKATCEHSDEKSGYAEHTFNVGEITTPATEETEGERTLTCTACGYVKTEVVEKLPHTFDTENWEKDATHHWHKATCEHSDEKGDYAEHVGDWTVKTPADYGEPKVEEITCAVCSYHEERSGDYTGDFYMIVSDRFVVSDNVIIKGSVSRGSINTGDKISISGYDEELTALELYKGSSRTPSESLGYGDGEISIHLGTEANRDNINRGTVVSKSGTMRSYKKFSANIYEFTQDEGGPRTPIINNAKTELKIGDVSVGSGTIAISSDEGMVSPGAKDTIIITLDKAIPLYEGLGIIGMDNTGSAKRFRGTVMGLLNE